MLKGYDLQMIGLSIEPNGDYKINGDLSIDLNGCVWFNIGKRYFICQFTSRDEVKSFIACVNR